MSDHQPNFGTDGHDASITNSNLRRGSKHADDVHVSIYFLLVLKHTGKNV